jgi:hypothetical protein
MKEVISEAETLTRAAQIQQNLTQRLDLRRRLPENFFSWMKKIISINTHHKEKLYLLQVAKLF